VAQKVAAVELVVPH